MTQSGSTVGEPRGYPVAGVAYLDVQRVRYDVLITDPEGGAEYSLGRYLTGLNWEDTQGELACRVQCSFYDYRSPDGSLHEVVRMGSQLRVVADWGGGWRDIVAPAVVFTRSITADNGGQCSLVAYDPLIYLQKSKFQRLYEAGKAGKDILLDLFKEFEVAVGRVDGPTKPMEKFPARGTLAESVNYILRSSWLRGDDEFVCRWDSGERNVQVVRPGGNPTIYHIEAVRNALSATSEEDMHDLITQVQITGTDLPTIEDDPDPNQEGTTAKVRGRSEVIIDGPNRQFGLLREIVGGEDKDSQEDLEETAKTLLQDRGEPRRTQGFACPDIPFLRKGDIIRVTAGVLNAHFLVSSVSHDATSKTMTVSIDNSGTLARRVRRIDPSRKTLLTDDPEGGSITSGLLGRIAIPGVGLPGQ